MEKTCWCGGRVWTLVSEGQIVCQESEFHDPFADGRPDKIRALYLAGPMSGYKDCNYPLFHELAERLRNAGYKVVNPADPEPIEKCHYVDLLRADLIAMLNCDAVAVLENWWESTGARNEVQVAGLLKMPVRTVDDWLYFSGKLG